MNPKIAGKWMFIPLELIIIGFDPPPNEQNDYKKKHKKEVVLQAKNGISLISLGPSNGITNGLLERHGLLDVV